jgi:hypothetical protein
MEWSVADVNKHVLVPENVYVIHDPAVQPD